MSKQGLCAAALSWAGQTPVSLLPEAVTETSLLGIFRVSLGDSPEGRATPRLLGYRRTVSWSPASQLGLALGTFVRVAETLFVVNVLTQR